MGPSLRYFPFLERSRAVGHPARSISCLDVVHARLHTSISMLSFSDDTVRSTCLCLLAKAYNPGAARFTQEANKH
jgi:hypothetical protein